jgi:hypothetical protein
MGRIKKDKGKQGKSVTVQQPIDYNSKVPVFSLEKIQQGKYCLSSLDKDHKSMFADSIFRRKALTWKEITQASRHGLGTEKIPRSSIKAPTPKFITEDLEEFLVFRYNGRAPMVGYRQRDVFFVLWFDHDFTLYKH